MPSSKTVVALIVFVVVTLLTEQGAHDKMFETGNPGPAMAGFIVALVVYLIMTYWIKVAARTAASVANARDELNDEYQRLRGKPSEKVPAGERSEG